MSSTQREVYIVDGARTPFLKVRGKPGPLSASDLAVNAGRELLARHQFSPTDLGEIVLGCVMPAPDEVNIARIVALRLGCGKAMPAYTVQRNCASGMQAIDSAVKDIATGRHDLVMAGGTEAMSRAPLLWSPEMVTWLANLSAAKQAIAKLQQFLKFKFSYLYPEIALMKGLTDPIVNLSMGQTAEILAHRFDITRDQMDTFALESHKRVAEAQDKNNLSEIVAAYSYQGDCFVADDGVRRETSLEKLMSLKPIFDKKFGSVTAGNSSQVTDGAAVLLLASSDAVKKYHLPILGRIVDVAWAGVDPAEMGLGPVYSTTALLSRYNLLATDIDYWEINEAFSAQVLACLSALQSDDYCRQNLKMEKAFGAIPLDRLNVDGGAIALGHPVGASGARIVYHLAEVLRRNKAKRGVATICIGGGQGGAMLIENVSEIGA